MAVSAVERHDVWFEAGYGRCAVWLTRETGRAQPEPSTRD